MRFTCDTNELNTALSIVSRALAVRSTKPILEGILFESCDEGLRLTCTDLALGIETLLPATFSEEGRAVLPGKLLCEIIRKLPGGPCDITVGERMQATIRCASIRTTINGFDPVEYPELPQVEGASFELPQNTLKDMFGRTLFAIAQDESRPILTGCLMEISQTEMRVVALDGYRLALRKENVVGPAEPISAVVGGRVLGDIAKILADTEENVSLCFTRSHVRMNIGQTRVVARLLEGEFIRYRQILPEEWQTRVTVDRAELGSAIDRASLIAREGKTNLVCFKIDGETLEVTSNSETGDMEEKMQVSTEGKDLTIAFNVRYITDVLKAPFRRTDCDALQFQRQPVRDLPGGRGKLSVSGASGPRIQRVRRRGVTVGCCPTPRQEPQVPAPPVSVYRAAINEGEDREVCVFSGFNGKI